MKNFNSLLTLIDIYGSKFHLLINKKLKYKTWIGGVTTTFLSIIGLTFIYLFGNDFFFRKNPSFTESTIGEGYKTINLTEEKVIIAFRIEDMNGNYVNTSNYLYPKVVYYSAIPGEDGKSRSNFKEEYISYRLCEESDFEGSENLITLYGTLFCIEWKDKTFGGYWDNEFLYYFSFRIFYCNTSKYYSNNTKCSSVEELNELFSDKLLFSVYYSTVEFRVDNFKTPLSKKHTNYFTFLSYNFRKNDKIFLNELIVNDDKGWIINSHKNTSIWGGNEIKSDYEYYDNDKVTTEGFSSMIYSFNIYMKSTKSYYTRIYLKIPDVLYKIGGLITFFNILGKNINTSINLSMKELTIIRQLFDFTEEEQTKSLSYNKNRFNNSKLVLTNLNNSNSTNTLLFNNKKSNDNHDFIYSHNKRLFSVHWNNINSQQKKNKNRNNKVKKVNFKTDIYTSKINEKEIKEMKRPKIAKIEEPEKAIKIIIKKDLNKYLICCCSKNKKKDIYDFINEIFNEKCDILNYFNLFKDIGFIKDIFFTSNQILAIDSIKKLNINCKNEIKSMVYYENKIYKIINYFTNKFKSRTNSKIDNYIYEKLEHNIKDKIKRK